MTTAKILVVEDKAIIAKDIQKTLENAGYSVPATISRGEVAVEMAAELQPDLILMDIRLKGEMDGIEAAYKIRTRHDIPIIFLTAYVDEETLQRAISTGPYSYLLKPFDVRELEVAIRVALNKHRLEKQVRQQEKWLASTLQSIGDAILATDPQGTIIYLNPAATAITGWSDSEARGRNIEEVLVILDENNRTKVENPLMKALAEGTAATLDKAVILVQAGGGEVLIDDIATPILDENNGIIGGVVVFRSAEVKRQLENQLRQSQKLEAVGYLAAGMAHNFNNMLTVINLYTSLIKNAMAASGPNADKLEVIQNTTARASEMVQHLLSFSKNQEFEPQLLNLNEYVSGIQQIIQEILPANLALQSALQAAPDHIRFDPGQLEQVIMNLVLNARDAMPDGGKITMRTTFEALSQPRLGPPTGVPAGAYVCLAVADTGQGIGEEVLGYIFDPFFTTKAKGQGTGLGLSTCLGIIERGSGHILVESEPGRGTTFSLYFPSFTPPPAIPANQPAPADEIAR